MSVVSPRQFPVEIGILIRVFLSSFLLSLLLSYACSRIYTGKYGKIQYKVLKDNLIRSLSIRLKKKSSSYGEKKNTRLGIEKCHGNRLKKSTEDFSLECGVLYFTRNLYAA